MKSYKQFTASLQEELIKQQGTQYGSNPGGLHTDTDTGKQYYIKHYHNADQAKTEALTGKIYHHMGISTVQPEYREINGKPSVVTEWKPELQRMHPSEFEHVSPSQARDLGKMHHAAVLTKNWDIVGMEHDNIMKHTNGTLHAIDHGGSFNFRAQGGHKDYGSDINEYDSLIHNPQASGHVFSHIVNNHPGAMQAGKDAVRKINDEHVHNLFKTSGLSNWKELHSNFMERKKKLLERK